MNKKFNVTIVLILFWMIGIGQTFQNTKTADHQLIPGTNIYIVPPESFELSSSFKGFQKIDDPTSMIVVMKIPGPYSETSKGFNAEMLKTAGMNLISEKEIKIAEFEGKLIELEQSANNFNFTKQILVYGDETSTTLINGIYLKDAKALGESIKKSIHSVYIDTKLVVDARGALTYTLDETVGNLKFHSAISNGMIFNRDLKLPTESKDKATLVTEKSYAKVEIDNKKMFCISRLNQYPDEYALIKEKGVNEIEIDGLQGLELYANNNDDDAEGLYQVILFDENVGYYLFLGTYLKEHDMAIEDIKRLIKTFKRK